MRLKAFWLPLITLALSGCNRTACYGLTDREALDSIQRAYVNQGQMTPELARSMRVDQQRILGVERVGRSGEDAFVGMLFRQDDDGILSVRLFEDCSFQTSISENADLKNWAYPLDQPHF